MATHVHYRYAELEGDTRVHLRLDAAQTLCGCAFEGGGDVIQQDFVITTSKVDCLVCKSMVDYCKGVKSTEFKRK